jgi:indolepyruvate ferredoxin oxidoreductase
VTVQDVSLTDIYDLQKERIFTSGAQAIVRMLLMQRELDRRAGLNTAGFVSGYRGSPLGGLDHQLWKAGNALSQANIVFEPGLNEELAATACWGSQQAGLLGEGRYDGVFALWYGKGPGVDRSGDIFRHANLAGSSRYGGVVALMGDDHVAESSSAAHASEFAFIDAMVPILNPAGVKELVEYGLYGYALSRFAGTWTALKCVKDNIESSAVIEVGINGPQIVIPEMQLPPGGLNIRREVNQLGQEERMIDFKRAAAAEFIRLSGLNRIVFSGGANARLGIVTIGTSYLDTRQALNSLGIDETRAASLGVRLFKVACAWPFDFVHMAEFVRGLNMVIVIEEKRSLLEMQMREQLYGTTHSPVVVGKKDECGQQLLSAKGALDSNDIAIAIAERILKVIGPSEEIGRHVERLRRLQMIRAGVEDIASRTPHFCSGCPHNMSTRLPDGSIAGGGIGCHFMAMWMDRGTIGYTPMGSEGAQWIGQAPFSKRQHMFQNLGDGTYNHSGSLALRFAVAAGTNVTYKILFNDAVAMTGGQPVEGRLTVARIAEQVRAEGVSRIAVVSDEPSKYDGATHFPAGTTIHHRGEMDRLQRELRQVKGVSVLIYDQMCAAEKRRRRKRGAMVDPHRRVFINELVCEGCGDCGKASNCVSLQPLETEFGRKRRIDQSNCNKDFSCVDGFCPALVTVHGARPKMPDALLESTDPLAGLAEPPRCKLDGGWSAIVAGIGGTGIITVGAIIGMAAHLEGKGAGIIDMAGLAQKGGAVYSHIRIVSSPNDLLSIHVAGGGADLVLGCDLLVCGSRKVLTVASASHTVFVVNTAEVMPGEFTRSADFSMPVQKLKRVVQKAAGEGNAHFFNATKAALALFGDSIAANMFILGMAYQLGSVPVSANSIEKAIELNGAAVSMNRSAFRWGRKAAQEPSFVLDIMKRGSPQLGNRSEKSGQTLTEMIERRSAFLKKYQNRAYSNRYVARVLRVRDLETRVTPSSTAVTEAVARNLFKLMATKDEYEVARLYTDPSFQLQLSAEFEGFDRLEFHLAPPVFARRDSNGRPVKGNYGQWILKVFVILANFKWLRGTGLDPFGRTGERRMARHLLAQYESDLLRVEQCLHEGRLRTAIDLASVPESVRGFGHVRAASVREADERRAGIYRIWREQPVEADGDASGQLAIDDRRIGTASGAA